MKSIAALCLCIFVFCDFVAAKSVQDDLLVWPSVSDDENFPGQQGLSRSRRDLALEDGDNDNVPFVFNRTLVVTTMPFDPLMMLKPDATGDSNDDFTGYCKDLLDLMAQELNFTYILRLPVVDNGTSPMWSDMLKELLNGEADMALTGLTVTTERKKILDFTAPFMYSGLAVLYLKPFYTEPPWYAFATAVSWRVWLCLAGIYCLAALIFCIAARLSPEEKAIAQKVSTGTSTAGTQTGLGSHAPVAHLRGPRQQEPPPFSIGNCFWFLIAALLFRNTATSPKATSMKFLTLVWWFFSLLLLLLYVHVLAEAYSTTVNVQPIESVEDLARQNVVKYGALSGGTSLEYFKRARMALFNHMYETMSANPDVLERDYRAGVKRVLEEDGKYAFIMESVALDYYLTKHCELRRLGSDIARATYSIATAPGSDLASILSELILKFQEDGRMWRIDTKWFSYKKECDDGNEYIRDEGLPYLDLYNFGGAIFVVLVGLVVGLIIALVESCIASVRTAKSKHVSIRNQVVQDIRDSVRRKPAPTRQTDFDLRSSTPSPLPDAQLAQPLSITVPRLEIGPYDPQNTPDYNPNAIQQQAAGGKYGYPPGGVQVLPQHPGPGGRGPTGRAGPQARRQLRQQM